MPSTIVSKKATPAINAAKVIQKKTRTSKTEEDELEDWKKAKQLLKPKGQLNLNETDLKEILPRLLQATNPQQSDGLVEFNYYIGAFVPAPTPDHAVNVFDQKGTFIHKDSEEAQNQLIAQGIDPVEYFAALIKASAPEEKREEVVEQQAEPGEGEEQEDGEKPEAEEGEGGEQAEDAAEGRAEGEGEDGTGAAAVAAATSGKKLTNQFNFCERAALTYNNPCRTRDTQTIPPPTATFADNVLQWIIYDTYQEDYEEQQLEKEREKERREKDKMPASKHTVAPKKATGKSQLSEAVQGRVYECWKTIERMINQNTFDDIAKDYRYWEDPADEFREEEGTLLPLWKLSYDKTKKNTITDFCWSPYYYDLFAVCFGFLDFMKPINGGAICLFTLKNPSFPEFICLTESGVMCVDIHKKYPYMIVIGLYDGNVMVYNIQANCKEPAFKSDSVLQKHSGIVWEVKWAPDLPDGEMNFYSVSSDGKVNNWVLMQSEFAVTTIINLYLEKEQIRGPDGTLVKKKACASCVKFHPTNPNIYLVGTEEGLIYKCSTAYSSAYLLTYKAHHMPIYRIDFNKLNSDVFASCSGDWRVKIWENNRLEPLFVFDLGACVGDVSWAPYSSTVLGAVTSKGKAYIFDLNVNKYKPICIQAVVSKKKYKLTRISFNHKLPIIICGDDKGCVTTLKLSPNLRIPCKPTKKQQHLDQRTLQLMKLDKLLALVREPSASSVMFDPAGSVAES